MNNKLTIAAAGSGKTTCLVKKALRLKEGKILITTFTQQNEAEIRKKIIEKNRCIPENIIVQTWFSFLLQQGVRPFQGVLFEKKIKGLVLVNEQSGLRGYTKSGAPFYWSEERDFEKHYFSKNLKIYSDKLAKFVFRCDEKSNGNVIDRISRIYSHIFIDEVQDLAGYDLELLKLFFNSSSTIQLVGDPRQGTYSTNNAQKNNNYSKANIVNYFSDQIDNLIIDNTSLMTNYRCNKSICDLSNKLFPDYQATTSGNNAINEHSGVFFIKKQDIEKYLQKFNPIQLRDKRTVAVNDNYGVLNFGESKGLSFDRILIYPTKPFLDWLKDNSSELTETSRSKLYVALTRARHSVAIVNDNVNISNEISHYTFDESRQD